MIAGGMCVVGALLIVGVAVSQPEDKNKPKVEVKTNIGQSAPTLGGPAAVPPAPAKASDGKGGPSDVVWESVLKTLEEVRHQGLVTDIDSDTSVAQVKESLWEKLPEAKRTEVGQALAVFCGRSNESGRFEVEIKAEDGGKTLGSYKKTFDK